MKEVMEEYGGALVALVAALGVLALVAILMLRPGSVVSHGVEQMTEEYLGDDVHQSNVAMAEYYAVAPLELEVARTAVTGEGIALRELFCQAGGEPLQQVRILNDGEGAWEIQGDEITFAKRGVYCMRVYGRDAAGNDGSCYLWMSVGKENV